MKHIILILTCLTLAACGNPSQFPSQAFTSQNSGGTSNNANRRPANGPDRGATTTNTCGTPSATGLDISAYQPIVDWLRLGKSGVSFIFMKATEGAGLRDSLFKNHWEAAKSAYLYRGAYHFFHPAEDPVAQANLFLATVGSLGPDDLPPVLDWEAMDRTPTATNVRNAKTWLNLVEKATGRVPIIYTGAYYWEYLNNPKGFEGFPLFLAEYGVKCPTLPKGWTKWTFWQTGQGIDGGINGAVDQDNFNGSSADLSQFISAGFF